MRRFLIGLMAATLAAIGSGVVTTFADSPSNWQLADGSAQGSTGIASFNFSVPDKAHLLYNTKDASLLGNLTGRTMSASFTVSGATGAFTYWGQGTPSNPCGTPASVRLYFESIPPGAKFAYTNYWWADSLVASTVLAGGTFKLTANVGPLGEWSDWNGQPSATNADAFNAAAGNATGVALSFGGGCFFENGVGTTDGSGSLSLSAFTVQP